MRTASSFLVSAAASSPYFLSVDAFGVGVGFRNSIARRSAAPSFSSRGGTSLCSSPEQFEGTVVVCSGPTCTRNGGKKVLSFFNDMADAGKVTVETVKVSKWEKMD